MSMGVLRVLFMKNYAFLSRRYRGRRSYLRATHLSAKAADSELLDGQDSSAFAPSSHVGAGGTGAHPGAVSGGAAGFMTGADKEKLDGIAPGGARRTPPGP